MNRRDLFARIATIAAAVALAPAVKAEAAPAVLREGDCLRCDAEFPTSKLLGDHLWDVHDPLTKRNYKIEPMSIQAIQGTITPLQTGEAAPVAESAPSYGDFMRAREALNTASVPTLGRRLAVEIDGETRILEGQRLTFEAMQDDCAARGCSLTRQYDIYQLATEFTHQPREQIDTHWPATLLIDRYSDLTTDRLARVDAWRRGLHEQATVSMSSHTHPITTGPSIWDHSHGRERYQGLPIRWSDGEPWL